MILKLFSILLLVGCMGSPCFDIKNDIYAVTVENGGSKWNCGLKIWSADSLQFKEIHEMVCSLQKVEWINVRISDWRLDVYFNDENEELVRTNLMLFYTEKGEYVFKKKGNCYKNDAFAMFLIKELKISCNEQN